MDLRQLEYFVAVAEESNFTRAAGRCHVVQSALSYQIGRLERENGMQLFERTSRSVRLTAAGELLLPRARQILGDVALATAELAALSGVVTGTLRLGLVGSAMAATPLVEWALLAFRDAHPRVQLAISDTGSAHMSNEILGGRMDLAFVGLFADQLPTGIAHRVIAAESLVAIVCDRHPLAGRSGVSLADLAAAGPFVEMRAESGLRQQVDAAFAGAGVTRTVAFALESSENVVRFVGLDFGAALVPRSVAERPGVVRVDVAGLDARHPISVIHRAPQPASPAARAFLAVLIELLSPRSPHTTLPPAHGRVTTNVTAPGEQSPSSAP